jgi:hypothetical protein
MPVKRSEHRKVALAEKRIGGTPDTEWEAKFGVPRRRKFDGDYYTINSLHPYQTHREAKESAERMQKHGPYKYRIVSNKSGFWVYGRLAHIRKVPGQSKPRRY